MDQPTHATCSSCGEIRLADDFYPRSRKCKACTRAKQREWREANREVIAQRRKPYFAARKAAKAEYDRTYRQANRDRLAAQAQSWYRENAQRHGQLGKLWREANRDAVRALDRANYLANKDRRNRQSREWRKANPDQARQINAETQRRRRARIAGTTVEPIDYVAIWTGLCAICDGQMDVGLRHPDPMSKSVDHIVPLALGGPHTQDNVQWAHLQCNILKGARLA